MPAVIRWLAYINPLTYMTDSVRNLMLAGNLNIASVAADYAVLISVLALFIIIGGKLYSSVVN
jgi:ABC-type polysaccharide/polyol phosphate export permease